MYDCHVHSSFSGDSEMPPDSACDTAIHLGLEGIAFTDHLDIDYPDFDDTFLIDFNRYSTFMDALKTKHAGRLKVLKGIEVGIQPHVIEESDKIVSTYGFDYVIGSVHIIGGMDPYVKVYFDGKSKSESFTRYLEEILFSITNFKNYDIVGHIGYVSRYCNYDDRLLRYADHSDLLDAILIKVIQDGKGIEVNTSTLKTDIGCPMPEFSIVKRYKELGGELITLGSDAHFKEHIGYKFDFVRDTLKDIGFEYGVYFEERKPKFYRL